MPSVPNPDAARATGSGGQGAAVVIGASSDIGRAIAVQLGALGYAVVVSGRDEAALAMTAAACAEVGSSPMVVPADVTGAGELERVVAAVPEPLRCAVWAAGAFDWAPAQAADPAAWRTVLDVNLTAAALFTTHVLGPLASAAPSALVYVGSGASRQAFPGNAAYVASKHGLAGLARATFLDVRDLDVKVSLVSPGLVAAGAGLRSPAGQTRPETLLAPEDVAAAVRFVVGFPARGCPVEIELQPQRSA